MRLVQRPVDENRRLRQLNLETSNALPSSNALITEGLVMFNLLTTDKSRERLKSNRPRLAHLAARIWCSGAHLSRQQVPGPIKGKLRYYQTNQPINHCRRCLADAALYNIPGHQISPAAPCQLTRSSPATQMSLRWWR